jgi:asparagine synthase (glutamine-hydrolysing)
VVRGRPAVVQRYWYLESAVTSRIREVSDAEAIETTEAALRQSIRQCRVADVPLGAFLSGGVDSSTVVGLMQAESSRPVKTFSVGFDDPSYDEAVFARRVAEHLGTDHEEIYVSAEDAMRVVPDLATIYDEPFADSSQIPTYLVSRLARASVTVALTGDGGDELFGGYPRYQLNERIWSLLRWVPFPLRRGLYAALHRVPPNLGAKGLAGLTALLRGARSAQSTERWQRVLQLLRVESREGLYDRMLRYSTLGQAAVIDHEAQPERSYPRLAENFVEQMMYLDTQRYLPDDILVKLDRAAMAVSLETRAPMLDHRFVETVWRLPFSTKRRNGCSKWLLKQILHRYVPVELVDRPKMGFGVPIGAWLRGPLRDWADSLISENQLSQQGLMRPKPIRQQWAEHTSGSHDWGYSLWAVLMFQAWYDRWQKQDEMAYARRADHGGEPAVRRFDFARARA